MPNYNFSTEEKQVRDLMLDLARGEYSLVEGVTKKDLEQHLRDTINNDLLGGVSFRRAMRRNKTAIFEIIEDIITTAISENILESPFIDSFVEVKNRAMGDQTAWYSEGGLMSVASFAGNHWDTNRQRYDIGEEFTLPAEWIYIHVYEEFERFLVGASTLEKFIDKAYMSINKYIQDRLYAQFQNVAGSIPADFSRSGNDEESLGELVDLVQAAGGYSNITIAGTKAALRKIVKIIPENTFANSQKEAKAATGSIGEWEGNKLMTIPQTLKSGTFELALSDSQLFIMGGDVKPIKLEYIGDTYVKEVTDFHVNNDMTEEWQLQTKLGMGLLLPEYFGMYSIA